jgi:hypothetical protein
MWNLMNCAINGPQLKQPSETGWDCTQSLKASGRGRTDALIALPTPRLPSVP